MKFKIDEVDVTVRKLDLQPNDVVVLETKYQLSEEERCTLRAQFQETTCCANRVLILEGGLQLYLLRIGLGATLDNDGTPEPPDAWPR